MPSHGFFKHSFWYFFAEVFNKGLAFLTLPVFTFLLTPAEFGVMSIFTTLTAILIVVMGLSSHQSIVRNYHNQEINFNVFLGALLPFIALCTVFFVGCVYVFKSDLSVLIKVDEKIIFLASLVAFCGVFLQLELSYLLASKKSKAYTKILILRNTLIITLSVVFILSLDDDIYYGRFYAELIIGVCLFLFSVLSLVRLSKLSVNFGMIKASLKYSLPLVISGLAGLILLSSDVIFINSFLGSEKAGLYAFAFSISMIIYVLISAINNAWLPFYYQAINENQTESIENVAILNVKIVLFFSFLVVVCSKYVVLIIAPESYYEAHVLIPVIAVGFVFLFFSNLFVAYLMYCKKTVSVAIIILIAAMINVGLNYYFIPIYGYFVAAWTTLISYTVLFMLNFAYVFFQKEKHLPLFLVIRPFLIFIVLLLVSEMIEIEALFGEVFFKIILLVMLIYFYKLHEFNFKKIKQAIS